MNTSLLLFGGSSGERHVSVASAQNLSENYPFEGIVYLDPQGALFHVTKTELAAHTNPFVNEFKPMATAFAGSLQQAVPILKNKIVFLALHGTEGEDGQIQSLFEKNLIRFTGSDAKSSQNAFDKGASKKIVAAAGVNVTEELVFSSQEASNEKDRLQDFLARHQKIVLKPLANGSSIGLFIVDQTNALDKAIQQIQKDDIGGYIAEKFIQGRELTVGIYDSAKGLVALPPSEVVMIAGRNFDYEGKYLGKGSEEITPARLTLEEIRLAQKIAMDSHLALKCGGYSRTDMILMKDGMAVYLETNTLPGLSLPSFIPQQLNVADIKLSQFVQRQLDLAEKRSS